MEIYILRHGIAEAARPGTRDADRALTSEGARKLRAVLRRAREARVAPAVILTSPYRRARETAEIAAEVLGVNASLITTQTLVPAASPEEVWGEIRAHRSAEQVLLAGHEPLLGGVYAHLLGTRNAQIDVKKGSLGRVDVEQWGRPPYGVLRWLLTPKIAGAD